MPRLIALFFAVKLAVTGQFAGAFFLVLLALIL